MNVRTNRCEEKIKGLMHFRDIRHGQVFQKVDKFTKHVQHPETFYIKIKETSRFKHELSNAISLCLGCKSEVEPPTLVKLIPSAEVIVNPEDLK